MSLCSCQVSWSVAMYIFCPGICATTDKATLSQSNAASLQLVGTFVKSALKSIMSRTRGERSQFHGDQRDWPVESDLLMSLAAVLRTSCSPQASSPRAELCFRGDQRTQGRQWDASVKVCAVCCTDLTHNKSAACTQAKRHACCVCACAASLCPTSSWSRKG